MASKYREENSPQKRAGKTHRGEYREKHAIMEMLIENESNEIKR